MGYKHSNGSSSLTGCHTSTIWIASSPLDLSHSRRCLDDAHEYGSYSTMKPDDGPSTAHQHQYNSMCSIAVHPSCAE
jgi:hypothetical protein